MKGEEQAKQVENGFRTGIIHLSPGDKVYLSSDGYPDQAGVSHKRYNRKRLSEFLLRIHAMPLQEQGDSLYEEIERWREEGNEDQTDDITVIGIRV
jgi:serine phosphatase RsbU (regulator of sigma subunit)